MPSLYMYIYIIFIIYLLLALLGLHCYVGFSLVVESEGYSVAVLGPLLVVAALVLEHRL